MAIRHLEVEKSWYDASKEYNEAKTETEKEVLATKRLMHEIHLKEIGQALEIAGTRASRAMLIRKAIVDHELKLIKSINRIESITGKPIERI